MRGARRGAKGSIPGWLTRCRAIPFIVTAPGPMTRRSRSGQQRQEQSEDRVHTRESYDRLSEVLDRIDERL